ncbi:FliM/FliN family flagellar motor switch protein [Paraneptunicella aestuarii]|uniref:FliM/FliN family flagellar motor switch protein n=1 Tax=Paraneptunicella aestuarii TaxID=2831148 RepID=UPI001E4A33A1|nr:FliM/FliN family flagellar motor switch protein [Paraneptunicella aestuarii]UAA37583.1 FliM/FliN family flagellar motor switch protein [Paraneptunicella aestuarii]
MTVDTNVKHIELAEVISQPSDEVLLSQRDFQLVKSVPVNVEVSLGGSTITLEKLFSLKAGEVLSLDKQIDEPINLIVDGNVIATGNLVAVNGQFGVEITEVSE